MKKFLFLFLIFIFVGIASAGREIPSETANCDGDFGSQDITTTGNVEADNGTFDNITIGNAELSESGGVLTISTPVLMGNSDNGSGLALPNNTEATVMDFGGVAGVFTKGLVPCYKYIGYDADTFDYDICDDNKIEVLNQFRDGKNYGVDIDNATIVNGSYDGWLYTEADAGQSGKVFSAADGSYFKLDSGEVNNRAAHLSLGKDATYSPLTNTQPVIISVIAKFDNCTDGAVASEATLVVFSSLKGGLGANGISFGTVYDYPDTLVISTRNNAGADVYYELSSFDPTDDYHRYTLLVDTTGDYELWIDGVFAASPGVDGNTTSLYALSNWTKATFSLLASSGWGTNDPVLYVKRVKITQPLGY